MAYPILNESNIVLIGMPGAGKSTCGVLAAKLLLKNFFDTDLLIQNTAVGNHKNRVNHGMAIFLKTDQLMCKPRYRV